MNKKKISALNSIFFLKIFFSLILSSISAFTEEELTLDEEIPVNSKQNESSSQNKTVPKATPIATKPSQVENKSSLLTEVTALYEKKEYAKLTTLLWAKIDLLNREELIILVKAHYNNKEYLDSAKAANLILAKDEKDEEALTYLGLNSLKRKKDREAKEFFRKATEINPMYSPALDGLVEIYEKNNNFYELRLIYQDLIKKVGEKPEYIRRLCDINTKDGVNDAAIEFCKKGTQADPKTPENHVNLGLVYKNISDPEKAKKQLQFAAIKFPLSDYAQMQYATFLEEQKNFIEAYKYYNLCNKASPYIEKCWVGLATSSYHLLKFQDSYVALKKACNFNRKHSIVGRKAALQARNVKQSDWAKKFEQLSEICGN